MDSATLLFEMPRYSFRSRVSVLTPWTSLLRALRSRMKVAVCSRISFSWVWCSSCSFWSSSSTSRSHWACRFLASATS